MLIQDITWLIVSSAKNLAIYDAKHLNDLYESVNKDWNSAEEFESTHSQLNYSVRFRWSAFTQK